MEITIVILLTIHTVISFLSYRDSHVGDLEQKNPTVKKPTIKSGDNQELLKSVILKPESYSAKQERLRIDGLTESQKQIEFPEKYKVKTSVQSFANNLVDRIKGGK